MPPALQLPLATLILQQVVDIFDGVGSCRRWTPSVFVPTPVATPCNSHGCAGRCQQLLSVLVDRVFVDPTCFITKFDAFEAVWLAYLPACRCSRFWLSSCPAWRMFSFVWLLLCGFCCVTFAGLCKEDIVHVQGAETAHHLTKQAYAAFQWTWPKFSG